MLMRGFAVAAVIAATGATLVAQNVPNERVAARKAELQRMLDAYAGGDREIVAVSIHARLDSVTRMALEELLRHPVEV